MFRFASLGSGSRGNATLVQSDSTTLLIDCGFAAREIAARCAKLGVEPGAIDALLVTHEHGDHMRGVGATARRFDLPVWMSHGTWHAADFGKLSQLHRFSCHDQAFSIGDIEISPVAVPHDAREPTQFIFRQSDYSFGMLTDLGSLTPHITQVYADLDALLLECNHDLQMLANGPYPPSLQARVGGKYGHLNNQQAAAFLGEIDFRRLRHLVVAHLSEKNNHPDLALAALKEVDACISQSLSLLGQDEGSDWFHL